jgi:PHD/YefM family antitoxin component YafN of YafNO toxin-antitoxin module
LVNNKPEAVILSSTEYDRMKNFIRAEEMRREGEEARTSGKSFKNGRALLNDLLA